MKDTGKQIPSPISKIKGRWIQNQIKQNIDFKKSKKLDEYGGLMAYDFGGTGFFRLEKRKRWWMVTPQGHAFLPFGINHIHTNWMKCAYNYNFRDNKFKTAYPKDKNYFNTGILNKVKEDLLRFGFKNPACHNDGIPIIKNFPYIKVLGILDIDHYKIPDKKDFADVFSKEYSVFIEDLVKKNVKPVKDDPYLIGYFFDACPIYTEADAASRPNVTYGKKRPVGLPTFPRVLRNLGPSAAGEKSLCFINERALQ